MLTLLALVLTPALASAGPNDPLLDWHLDGTSGLSVPDSSGNGNDGTLNQSATVLSDGRFDGALRLAGGGGGVRVERTLGSNMKLQSFTTVIWIRANGYPGDGNIMAIGAGTCSTPIMQFQNSGTAFTVIQGASDKRTYVPGAELYDGRWHMLAVTARTGVAQQYIYLDGAPLLLDDTGVQAGTLTYPTTSVLTLGGSHCASPASAVDFDEFQYYPRELTDAEIAYMSRSRLSEAPELPVPSNDPGWSGLISQWHLSGGDSNAAPHDTGPRGSFAGTSTAPFTSAKFGNGIAPAAADQGVLSPGLQPQKVSVLAWVKRNGSPGAIKQIVADGGSSTCIGSAWALDTGNGGLRFNMVATNGASSAGTTQTEIPATAIWDGNWHAVAGIWDGTKAQLWVDGTKVKEETLGVSGNLAYGGSLYTDPYLAIGRYPHSGCGASFANSFTGGQIDEVKVYDRALFTDEIQWLQDGTATVARDLPDPLRAPEPGPTAIDKPTISGNPSTGGTGSLTCSTGTWTGHPTTFMYTWERGMRGATTDADQSWTAIPGATGNTYAPTPADAAARVRCHVYAQNFKGTGDNPSLGIRTDPAIPAVVAAPQVVGVVAAGSVVRCDPGQWTNYPSFDYQWLRDGQPIGGATGAEYTIKRSYNGRDLVDGNGDGQHKTSCRVTAANDVGAASSVDSSQWLALDGVPVNTGLPDAHLEDGRTNNVGRRAFCQNGQWLSDSALLGEPNTGYAYQWLRNGQPIGGATGQVYVLIADDLGTTLSCQVRNSNEVGPSALTTSPGVEIPLPTKYTEPSEYKAVFRDSRYDPVNIIVTPNSYVGAIASIAQDQFKRLVAAETDRCKTMKSLPAAPTATVPPKFPLTTEVRCAILVKDPTAVQINTTGVKWFRGQFCQPGTTATTDGCNNMGFTLPPADPTKPASIDSALQTKLEQATPSNVVWDVDGDGKTDIVCPGSAPVVRGLLDPGLYKARGVVVFPDTPATGRIGSAEIQIAFPNGRANLPAGKLRSPSQPLWCRTSIVPPPDPKTGPCTQHGAIGNVQLEGNLCPINLRATPDAAFDGLPGDTLDVLQRAAEAIAATERDAEAKPKASTDLLTKGIVPDAHFSSPLKPDGFLPTALQKPATLEYVTARNTLSSLSAVGQINAGDKKLISPNAADQRVASAAIRGFVDNKALFATDQIYSAVGDLKVNGVTIDPTTALPTLIVPSDAGEAVGSVRDVKKMTINAKSAVTKMAVQKIKDGVNQQFSDLQLSAPEEINQLVKDLPNSPDQLLKQNIDLDALKARYGAQLEKALNLGPFKLAGTSADIKLQKNGTAVIHAQAELPIIQGSDGHGLRTDVTLSGDENGNIKLQGVSLAQRKDSIATLFGLQLKGLLLSYDPTGGLTIKGQITFPASGGQGIDLRSFQLDSDGGFKSLDVDYLTGIGQGIPIGPGVFLTKLGGGLYNDDKAHYTAIRAGGAVSAIAPSAGGGCPTVGTSGDLNIQFRPAFEGHVHGDVNVVCIPIGGMDLDVYPERGDLHLNMHWGLDLRLIRFGAQLEGNVHVDPNMWQIEYAMGVKFPFLKNPLTGVPSASAAGVLSNKGAAICADVLGFDVGVGVHFSNGRPPLTYLEFLANLRAFFDGCDRSEFASFPLQGAQAGGVKSIKLDGSYVTLAIDGAGGAPKVQLRSPSGKVYDYSTTEDANIIDDTMGAVLADEARTIVILKKPEKGTWTVAPVEGSAPIVRIQHASKLPKPKVTGKVTGKGQNKTLTYNVRPIKGQVVNFVEESDGGHRIVKTVKTGGKGRVGYVVAESAGSKRELTAEVVQNDMPRDNIVIATYRASNPKVGKPKVKIKRRGSKAVVTWSSAVLATKYYVTITAGSGERYTVMPKGRKRTVTIARVGKKDAVLVSVRGVSAGGRQGPLGKATLRAPKKKRR